MPTRRLTGWVDAALRLALACGLLFLIGHLWPTSWRPGGRLQVQEAASDGPAGRLLPEARETVELLDQVSNAIRQKLAERQAIEQRIKHDQATYQTLRFHGAPEDAPTCCSLAAKQQRNLADLRRLRQEIVEAQGIEASLVMLVAEMTAGRQAGTAGPSPMRRARSLLLRSGIEIMDHDWEHKQNSL